jgi:hypothetical protein
LYREWLRRRDVSEEAMNLLNCHSLVTNKSTKELECLNDTKTLVLNILKNELGISFDHQVATMVQILKESFNHILVEWPR